MIADSEMPTRSRPFRRPLRLRWHAGRHWRSRHANCARRAPRAGHRAHRCRLRKLLGPPLVSGFERAFGVTHDTALSLTQEYRELFDKTVTPSDFPPIDDVPFLLGRLTLAGRRMSIATSRKESGARSMVDQLGWTDRFECVMGLNEPVRLTKADSIRDALEYMGVDAADVVMVGDRLNDIEGAHACGVPCIGVYTGAAQPGEHDAADVSCGSMLEVARVLGVA